MKARTGNFYAPTCSEQKGTNMVDELTGKKGVVVVTGVKFRNLEGRLVARDLEKSSLHYGLAV